MHNLFYFMSTTSFKWQPRIKYDSFGNRISFATTIGAESKWQLFDQLKCNKKIRRNKKSLKLLKVRRRGNQGKTFFKSFKIRNERIFLRHFARQAKGRKNNYFLQLSLSSQCWIRFSELREKDKTGERRTCGWENWHELWRRTLHYSSLCE